MFLRVQISAGKSWLYIIYRGTGEAKYFHSRSRTEGLGEKIKRPPVDRGAVLYVQGVILKSIAVAFRRLSTPGSPKGEGYDNYGR